MSRYPPGYANSPLMTSSIFLTKAQRLMYNRTWLINYQLKINNLQEDTKNQIESIRAKYNALRLDDQTALEVWNLWKPKRTISALIESLVFYARVIDFLRSKQTEIDFLIAIDKDPNAVEPHVIAQHQVSHQSLLDAMDSASPPDCENVMAEIERGMYMYSEDGDKFEVNMLY